MMDLKKGAVVAGVAGIVTVAVVGIARALCKGLTFSFEAPVSMRVCKPYTMKGDIIKDFKGLAGISVTIYTELAGYVVPLVTVITDSIGHYKFEGILGTESHYPTYIGIGAFFWAEATIEGVLQKTDRVSTNLYGEYCDGPCPGTMKLKLRRK